MASTSQDLTEETRFIVHEGQRGGKRFLFQGKVYYFDREMASGIKVFRCRFKAKHCPGQAFQYPDGSVHIDKSDKHQHDHGHLIDIDSVAEAAYYAKLKEEVEKSKKSRSEIVIQVSNSSKENRKVADAKLRSSVESWVGRIQKQKRESREYKDISDFATAASEEMPSVRIQLSNDNGKKGVIFCGKYSIEHLKRAKTIHIQIFHNIQLEFPAELCVISPIITDDPKKSMPAMFIVSEGKMTDDIFNQAIQFAPDLKQTRTIITDFDKDIVSSIRSAFPEAKLRCSWLYVVKVLCQRWDSMNLEFVDDREKEKIEGILYSTWLLPLIFKHDPTEYNNAIERIEACLTSEENEKFPLLASYLLYIRTEWNRQKNHHVSSYPSKVDDITNAWTRVLLRDISKMKRNASPQFITVIKRNIEKIEKILDSQTSTCPEPAILIETQKMNIVQWVYNYLEKKVDNLYGCINEEIKRRIFNYLKNMKPHADVNQMSASLHNIEDPQNCEQDILIPWNTGRRRYAARNRIPSISENSNDDTSKQDDNGQQKALEDPQISADGAAGDIECIGNISEAPFPPESDKKDYANTTSKKRKRSSVKKGKALEDVNQEMPIRSKRVRKEPKKFEDFITPKKI